MFVREFPPRVAKTYDLTRRIDDATFDDVFQDGRRVADPSEGIDALNIDLRAASLLSKRLGRPLTDEELERFRYGSDNPWLDELQPRSGGIALGQLAGDAVRRNRSRCLRRPGRGAGGRDDGARPWARLPES